MATTPLQLLTTLLLVAALVPAALPCDDQDDAAGQCGASREPSMARLVEDLHGENVLSRLMPSALAKASEGADVTAKKSGGTEATRTPSTLLRQVTSPRSSLGKKAQVKEKTPQATSKDKKPDPDATSSRNSLTKEAHVKENTPQSTSKDKKPDPDTTPSRNSLTKEAHVKENTPQSTSKDKKPDPDTTPSRNSLTKEAHVKENTPQSTSKDKKPDPDTTPPRNSLTKEAHVKENTPQSTSKDKKPDPGTTPSRNSLTKEAHVKENTPQSTSKDKKPDPDTTPSRNSLTKEAHVKQKTPQSSSKDKKPNPDTTSLTKEAHVKEKTPQSTSRDKKPNPDTTPSRNSLSKEAHVKEKTPQSTSKDKKPNPDTTPQRHVKEKATPQSISKDKKANREVTKPSGATQEEAEPQRRSASNVERTETSVGKEKWLPSLSREKSSNPEKAPAAEISIRPSSSDSKEVPGKDKTLSQGKLRAGNAPKAAENQIVPSTRNPDRKEAHLKDDAGKDKTAPSLAKGKSSDAIAVAGAKKKVLPSPGTTSDMKGPEGRDVTSAEDAGTKQQRGKETPVRGDSANEKTSPSPSDQKTAEKKLPQRPAMDSGRKEAHVKGHAVEDGSETEVAKEERKGEKESTQVQMVAAKSQQQGEARLKRDVEERPQEAGDVERVVEAGSEVTATKRAAVAARENVTGESLPGNGTKSDGVEKDQSRLPEPSPGKANSEREHLVEGKKVEASSKQGDQGGTAENGVEEEVTKVKDAKKQQPSKRAEIPAEPSGGDPRESDEHVHFVAGGESENQKEVVSGHGGEEEPPAGSLDPEALPLEAVVDPEDGPPSAMSLKTRRHPDIDDDGRGQEGDEARQVDPRRFPPGGGYRPSGKSEAPVLQFPALPEGETFRTPELGLSEGLFLFSYLGDFLSWLQPYDFPVELIRDALWNRVTVTDLITESLQVEIGFIVCLCIGALLALMLPVIAVCHACCNMVRGSKKSSGDRNSWDSSSSGGSCRRRGLLCSLHLVLLLLAAGVAAMFVTNEQVSNAVHSTPSIVHTALGDVGAFVRTTHHQLSFVTTKSLEQALSAATDDLDNADVLLGRPIQQEIAHEAGADVALEALSDVLTAVNDVSQKAVVLHEQCSETRGLALVAKERLADLRHQVDMAKRQCVGRDRALCDTLDVSGLDVVIKLEMLMSDDQLAALRSLRNGNFSAAAQQARGDFQLIPREVEESTRDTRLGIRRELVRQQTHVQDSLVSLDSLSRDVGVRVDAARNLVLSAMQTVEDMEQWRWLVGLGASLTMLLLWVLLICGAACGCCGSQEKARTTLIVGVCMTSVFSLVLWVMTLVTLVMGGHGEVFICRPLYASPDYSALSHLLDRPGVLFPRGGGGFFRNVVGGDGGPNRTLDVPLRQVLQECEAGIPAYNALQLRQVFDTEFATGHGRWDSLRMQLSRLNVDVASLRVLTPGLQVQLGNILTASGANVTQHRLALGGAVTARDLNTLADQLLGIASQAADLAMASRLETLAARTRRLLASHVLPLEQRKEDLVYRLTALEVSLAPLQRQTNQSLSHLKAIQYYVTHQGESIAQSAVNHYTTRILSYLQQARAHILTSVVKDVAPCRPLFEVFNAARQLLCRHIVDPLNGLWFASALSLLLLLIATPLCLKLVDAFKQNREGGLLTSNMSESPSETVDMPGNWNTPGTGEQDGW